MLYLYPPCMNICYIDTCPWKVDRLLREDAKGRCLAFPLLIVWLGSQWEMTTWFGFDLFPTSPKLEWLDGKVVRFPFKMEKLFHCSFNHSNLFLLFGLSPPINFFFSILYLLVWNNKQAILSFTSRKLRAIAILNLQV